VDGVWFCVSTDVLSASRASGLSGRVRQGMFLSAGSPDLA